MSPAPIVIAHRGASGYLPEHTLEGKALAHGLGADFIEQDVIATRDGELIVLHDLFLERVTDVATRFPGRQRDDGHFYALDFSLSEIRSLCVAARMRAGGRAPLYPARFPAGMGSFRVPTLREEIELVQGLNRSTGKSVGLYTEVKHPRWHSEHGIDLTRHVIEELARSGYREEADPVFVQCFDEQALRRAREELGTRLRLVQLIDGDPDSFVRGGGVARAREYAQGLGTPYSHLVGGAKEGALTPSALARQARSHGLLLHPFTFKREELPPWAESLEHLLAAFFTDLEVDGVFCDFPDVAVRVRNAVLERKR